MIVNNASIARQSLLTFSPHLLTFETTRGPTSNREATANANECKATECRFLNPRAKPTVRLSTVLYSTCMPESGVDRPRRSLICFCLSFSTYRKTTAFRLEYHRYLLDLTIIIDGCSTSLDSPTGRCHGGYHHLLQIRHFIQPFGYCACGCIACLSFTFLSINELIMYYRPEKCLVE